MPLFGYASTGVDSYVFESFPFRFKPLETEDIIEMELFSKQDIEDMRGESWCLVFTGDEADKYIRDFEFVTYGFPYIRTVPRAVH